MKCLALGLIKNGNPVEWHVPAPNRFGFFNPINEQIQSHQQELLDICYGLKINTCEFADQFGYFLAAYKTSNGCCMVVCDDDLSQTEMSNLARWMLESDATLETIAKTFDICIKQEPRIYQIKKELKETKEILHDGIEKMIERGGEIEELLKKTGELQAASVTFRDRTNDLNSCWPKWCSIL